MMIEEKSQELLEDFGLLSTKTDLKSLCKKLDLEVVSHAFDGCEGVLIVTPDNQKILIKGTNAAVRNRFTIAHEIGHYTLHMPESGARSFNCTKEQIRTDLSISENEESQANHFASSLLMPKSIFQSIEGFSNPGWDLLNRLAVRHDVSTVAAATRYISLTTESMWLVIVKSGIIKRFVKSAFAESKPSVGHQFISRKIDGWIDIGANHIFYDNRWIKNKIVSVTSLGQNEFGENLILVWDKGHSLMNFGQNDDDLSYDDDDEEYERSTRGRYY